MRNYTEQELTVLPGDSRLLFADSATAGVLVYVKQSQSRGEQNQRRVYKTPADGLSLCDMECAHDRVQALRCLTHGSSSFSLYPTTDHQHAVNYFLWKAAHDCSFTMKRAAELFQRNVYIISMPANLFDFLTQVTWEELQNTMMFTLANLASYSDGLHVLQKELAPALTALLKKHVERLQYEDEDGCDLHAFRLLLDNVMDRIPCMGPWMVSTMLCYLSTTDMTELLAQRYDRPIFSKPEKYEMIHTVMWNLFKDWRMYKYLLVQLGGRSTSQALNTMAQTIARGTQHFVAYSVGLLLQISSQSSTSSYYPSMTASHRAVEPLFIRYLSSLPTDIIAGSLIPSLCEAYARQEIAVSQRTDDVPAKLQQENPLQQARVQLTVTPFSLKSLILEHGVLLSFYQRSHAAEEMDTNDDSNHAENDNDDAPAGGSGNNNSAAQYHGETPLYQDMSAAPLAGLDLGDIVLEMRAHA